MNASPGRERLLPFFLAATATVAWPLLAQAPAFDVPPPDIVCIDDAAITIGLDVGERNNDKCRRDGGHRRLSRGGRRTNRTAANTSQSRSLNGSWLRVR